MSKRKGVLISKIGNKWNYGEKLSDKSKLQMVKNHVPPSERLGEGIAMSTMCLFLEPSYSLSFNVLLSIIDWNFRKVLIAHSLMGNKNMLLLPINSNHVLLSNINILQRRKAQTCPLLPFLANYGSSRKEFIQNTAKQKIL